METKFTPGPWSVYNDHPDEDTRPCIGYIRAKPKYDECEIATIYLFNEEERAANARLIAAAPKMFAALIECESMLDEFDANSARTMRIRSAIAEATGA